MEKWELRDKTIIINNQLLGDGLMTTPAIHMYRHNYPNEKIVLATSSREYNNIYKHNKDIDEVLFLGDSDLDKLINKFNYSKITRVNDNTKAVRLDAGCAFRYCQKSSVTKKINNKLVSTLSHLSYGFANQMNVTLRNVKYFLDLEKQPLHQAKKEIAIAAISASCSLHDKNIGVPNKTILMKVWQPVVDYIKDIGYNPVFLHNNSDIEEFTGDPSICRYGMSIMEVANYLSEVRLLLTIDSGLGHLSSAVNGNIVSLCAAVHSNMTSVEHTSGYYSLVNHTADGPGPYGISTITSEEIIDEIRRFEQCNRND